jgi:Zn-dependent peptidase ImmA (M78 family)
MIELEDIYVNYADLPCTIGAFVVSNNDDTYTIILNSRLSRERNKESYIHELGHIRNGDYEKKCSVDIIEIAAHK